MEFLSSVLDMTCNLTAQDNKIRDDQATLLVLACATFREIPPKQQGKCNMSKYLHFAQETTGHARWLTTANGYLRIKHFHIGNLKASQLVVLNKIVQFIVDVYVPSFFQIYLHPSAVEGPSVVLKIRNFMKACEVSCPAKKCFITHGAKWLNPTTAALGALDENIDVSKVSTTTTPDTKALLWSHRPLTAFFDATSAASPCLTTGSLEDWKAFRNNNMSCERLIGQVKETINKKKVSDTHDVDIKLKGYINHAFYL